MDCVFVCTAHSPSHQCLYPDVKPSNVLINTLGQVKMCDFGISGHLVDSVAKTMDAGCKPYMAVSQTNRIAFYFLLLNTSYTIIYLFVFFPSLNGSTLISIKKATVLNQTYGV